MPEFTNPFIGLAPDRKMTRSELVRAIRLDIAAEHEATHIYEAQRDATDHPLAREVLHDIANEEREHIGEFQRLLSIIDPTEDQFIANGVEEVDEMAAELGAGGGADGGGSDEGPDEDDDTGGPTVGDLKE